MFVMTRRPPRQSLAPLPSFVDDALRAGSGRALEPAVRESMEERFAHDFSRVRVHADNDAALSATVIGASAYTVGNDIVFAGSNYAPNTPCGHTLLAHELGHVVQQAGRQRPSVLRVADGHAANGEVSTNSLSEQTIQRQPASDPHIGPGLPSMPSSLGGFTIRLQLDSNMVPTGKASIAIAGPGSIPLVGGGEIGLQRNVDGTYSAVTGKGTTIVSAADVKKILQGSTIVDSKKPKEIRLPGCDDLRRPGRGAFYTVSQFKQHAMFTPGVTGVYWNSLPDWLIEALIESCIPAPFFVPDRPPRPDYNDAPPTAGDTQIA